MPTPPQLATDKKAAVLLAAGCEEVEALAVVDALFRAGIRADLVSVSQSLEVVSSHRIRIIADALIADVDLADYDLLYLPGHVMLANDPYTVIHASGHHMHVVAENLADALARYRDTMGDKYRLNIYRWDAKKPFVHVFD